jgi:ATP-dependent Lon protease
VLLPDFNRKDLEEISIPAREGIRFEFLKTVDEALDLALEPDVARNSDAAERLAS